MTVYILLPLLIALMIPAKKNKIAFGVVFLSMLLMSALRSENVGTDTINYLYTHMESGNLAHFELEPIWHFLMEYTDSRSYLIISTFLLIIPLTIFVRKHDNPILLLFFYVLLCFFSDSFNITRQEVAVCYVLLGFSYFEKKNWVVYYTCIAVAVCIHNTAFLAALFPLLKTKLKLSSMFVYISLPVSYVIGVMMLSSVVSFMTPILGHYETAILNNEYVKTSAFSLNRIFLNVVFVLVYTSYAKEKRNDFYLKLFYIAVLLYNLLAFSGVANRIALYFSISQIIVFTNFQNVKKEKKEFFILTSVIYTCAYYALTLINNRGGILPYEIDRYYETIENCYNVALYGLLSLTVIYLIEYISNKIKKNKKLILC